MAPPATAPPSAGTGAELCAARRGRPRDAGADELILTATVELLNDGGIAGLSMDQVARRAGVSKATIYRRWVSKEELVLAALSAQPTLDVPDTGSVRGDLLAYTATLAEIATRPTADVLPHLIEAACYDGRIRASLNELSRSRQRALRAILRRGHDRGELDGGDDDAIVDAILGAFFYRRLISGEPFTPKFAARLVDLALRRGTQ
jgi:AcrR family transcriptional regulator